MLQAFFNHLRINVVTLFTLLQVLLSEFDRSIDGNSPSNIKGSGSAKLSVMMRRLLPALRHYSSWLISNATILSAGVGDPTLSVRVQELWKVYANTLTILVSSFPVSSLPSPIEYLLEEDEDTLGFKPFDNERVHRKYCSEATGSRKPKWHDRGAHRQHPNIEMLGRIRDILTDGMVIVSQQVSTQVSRFIAELTARHRKYLSCWREQRLSTLRKATVQKRITKELTYR